eukprot:ctg_631.g338
MSAIGIDFGNANCVVARAQRGGIDVIANEVSNRQTPALVSFCGGNERYAGEAAANRHLQNLAYTITEVKRVLGRSLAEDELREMEVPRALYHIVPEMPQGGEDADSAADYRVQLAAVEVHYSAEQLGTHALETWHLPPSERQKALQKLKSAAKHRERSDVHVLPTESVAAILLHRLADTVAVAAASEGSTAARDVVLAVPFWYTDAQRAGLLDAGVIGGVRVLRIIHEHLAAALSYGLYRANEFPESDQPPVNALIVDVGQSQTTVTCVSFWRTRLQVLAVGYDRCLGGRDFDEALFRHFEKEFAERYKLNVQTNPKAVGRLRAQCERAKKMLSANAQAPLNIDCFMNDVDVSGMIDRATFEQLVAPLVERISAVATAVMQRVGGASSIQYLELLGGGSRMPLVQSALERATGRSARRTMNAEESIARGCALQAAMIAPGFKVRDYEAVDVLPFSVCITKVEATVPKETTVFAAGSAFPGLRRVTYTYTGQPFQVHLYYGVDDPGDTPPSGRLPEGCVRDLALVEIGTVPGKREGCGKVHVKVRMDANGMVSVVGAQLVEEIVEVNVADANTTGNGDSALPPMDTEASSPSAAPPTPTAPDSTNAEASAAPGAAGPSTRVPTAPSSPAAKPRLSRTELPFRQLRGTRLQPYAVEALTQVEAQMQAADRYRAERAEALNALETYVYDMRSRIGEYGAWAEYATDAVRTAFLQALDDTEEWIYSSDGGESASKSQLAERLLTLQRKYGNAIATRVLEADLRHESVRQFQEAVAALRAECASGDERRAHITAAERQQVLEQVAQAEAWLQQTLQTIETAGKHVDAPVRSSEIDRRLKELQRSAREVLDRPPPTNTEKGGSAKAKPDEATADTAADDAAAAAAPDAPPEDAMRDA